VNAIKAAINASGEVLIDVACDPLIVLNASVFFKSRTLLFGLSLG
jgi:hypothetical protein